MRVDVDSDLLVLERDARAYLADDLVDIDDFQIQTVGLQRRSGHVAQHVATVLEGLGGSLEVGVVGKLARTPEPGELQLRGVQWSRQLVGQARGQCSHCAQAVDPDLALLQKGEVGLHRGQRPREPDGQDPEDHRHHQLRGEQDLRVDHRTLETGWDMREGLQQQQTADQQREEQQAELSFEKQCTQAGVDEEQRHHRVPGAAGERQQTGEGQDVAAELEEDAPGSRGCSALQQNPGDRVQAGEQYDDADELRQQLGLEQLELQRRNDREGLRGDGDPAQTHHPDELRGALLGVGRYRRGEEGAKRGQHSASRMSRGVEGADRAAPGGVGTTAIV